MAFRGIGRSSVGLGLLVLGYVTPVKCPSRGELCTREVRKRGVLNIDDGRHQCLSMNGSINARKIGQIYFLTLASILFRAICVTEIGGKSILEGKSTIFSDLVDLPVLPG